jgi:hypothetical protein
LIQETSGGRISRMLLVSTFKNPAIFEGQEYNCVLIGDGKEQHFGTNITQFAPAKVYLKCTMANAQRNLRQ